MREKPILFSAPMVRAILSGSKSQTRRIVKPQPIMRDGGDCVVEYGKQRHSGPAEYLLGHVLPRFGCPYGQPGDRLWVRESWQYYDWSEYGCPTIRYAADNATSQPDVPEEWCDRTQDVWAELSRQDNYAIDNTARDRRWRPSIHMPSWASRIALEITGVRVERLQDISEADAIAEGTAPKWEPGCSGRLMEALGGFSFRPAASAYAELWESLNGDGSWDANPWVWVIEFKRV